MVTQLHSALKYNIDVVIFLSQNDGVDRDERRESFGGFRYDVKSGAVRRSRPDTEFCAGNHLGSRKAGLLYMRNTCKHNMEDKRASSSRREEEEVLGQPQFQRRHLRHSMSDRNLIRMDGR